MDHWVRAYHELEKGVSSVYTAAVNAPPPLGDIARVALTPFDLAAGYVSSAVNSLSDLHHGDEKSVGLRIAGEFGKSADVLEYVPLPLAQGVALGFHAIAAGGAAAIKEDPWEVLRYALGKHVEDADAGEQEEEEEGGDDDEDAEEEEDDGEDEFEEEQEGPLGQPTLAAMSRDVRQAGSGSSFGVRLPGEIGVSAVDAEDLVLWAAANKRRRLF
jgi:hypothetical protein